MCNTEHEGVLQVLDLEVREVRVVAVEDIRKMERRQIHNQRCARTQVSPVVGQQLLSWMSGCLI